MCYSSNKKNTSQQRTPQAHTSDWQENTPSTKHSTAIHRTGSNPASTNKLKRTITILRSRSYSSQEQQASKDKMGKDTYPLPPCDNSRSYKCPSRGRSLRSWRRARPRAAPRGSCGTRGRGARSASPRGSGSPSSRPRTCSAGPIESAMRPCTGKHYAVYEPTLR